MRGALAIVSALTIAASTSVHVRADDTPSFRHDIVPILSRAGCNGGGCHGALAGKGGFRLSLFGYDPAADHASITRDSLGRRIELSDPGRSLVLAKPTMALAHKGGRRLDAESDDYRTIAAWISSGAPGPRDDDPELVGVDVAPEIFQIATGETRQLTVTARYSDGRTRDVTRWVRFNSAAAAVASVDERGSVTGVGPGAGAITAWFSSKLAIARLSSPYPGDASDTVFAAASRANFIDDLVLEQLTRLRLPPSPAADPLTLFRRAHVDTIGRLPTPDETRTWMATIGDAAPGSEIIDRAFAELIDRLLARDEFVDYWSYRLSDLLLVSGAHLRPDAVKAYYSWIRARVADNTPWDELVRRLVTAKGSSVDEGATNFFAVHQDPESMAENVSQAFLSLSINCARCHNHPLEKWTNDQYYAFANLFARVRAKGWGGDPRSGDGRRTLFVAERGDLVQPRTGHPQPPAPLDAPPLPMDDPTDRREALAEWLTSPGNPYFARAIVNRLWASFLGVGIVEPIDDLRVSNPATNESLLSALAAHFVESEFDLRSTMRAILGSRTYQRSSEALPANAADTRNFARYPARRHMAEVLADAIGDVTGVRDAYDRVSNKDGSTEKTPFYAPGTRALELFDAAVESRFLDAFGRNPREITCECERSAQPSLVQALHLANGTTLNDKLAAADGRVTRLLAESESPDALLDEIWLVSLGRPPSSAERERVGAVLRDASEAERREVVEDIFWSLLTSREFLFQH